MFQGTSELNLDAKGRLVIPTRHRDALAAPGSGELVLTAHPHKCLILYPAPSWTPIRDKILAAPSFDVRAAAVKRLLVGMAQEVQMDAAGRLLIAPELRKVAALDKVVYMVGQGTHFEIWSEDGWNRQQDVMFAMEGDQLPAGMETLTL